MIISRLVSIVAVTLLFLATQLSTSSAASHVISETMTKSSSHKISVTFEAEDIQERSRQDAYLEVREDERSNAAKKDSALFMEAVADPNNVTGHGYSLEIKPVGEGVEISLIFRAFSKEKDVEKYILVRTRVGEAVSVDQIGCKCSVAWTKLK